MDSNFSSIIKALSALGIGVMSSGLKGLEKESLRVGVDGNIATTAHPTALGAALTHPHITTDYSEALLELVTGADSDPSLVLDELREMHQFVYHRLGAERLWVASMPCVLHGDASIPIATYGSSNVGRMKHVYRVGLGFRYGRIMQAIAGIHFNYSPPQAMWPTLASALGLEDGRAFRDARFMGMLRTLKSTNWLIAYLFGASPAVCKSFLPGGGSGLEAFDRNTWFYPYGTSLRLSDMGYSNRVVGGLRISYNSLDEYVDGLNRAITTPHPPYARIGTHRDGDWLQLNANVLQIENEYYSFVRPKRVPTGNEKRTAALARDGIEYVELRSMDLDPWAPEGLTIESLRFLELFALWALLSDSPAMTDASQHEQDENLQTVARCGRRPGLGLMRAGQAISLVDWACELLDNLAAVAAVLDRDRGGDSYSASVALQRTKIADPEQTPSAKVLAEMRDSGEAFFYFAQRRSESTQAWYGERKISPERLTQMATEAEQSLAQQASIEASDDQSFDAYLANYFTQN